MPELFLHTRKLDSVFELLGAKENDITYSIGWALSRCPEFLAAFLRRLFPRHKAFDQNSISVRLQEYRSKGGYTDIEIVGDDVHVVIEAKRGWQLPTAGQIEKYRPRFISQGMRYRKMVTMSECSQAYAGELLQDLKLTQPVVHFSWRQVTEMTLGLGKTHAEKRLLEELRRYISTIVNMQNKESNWVYVVALGRWPWGGTTFVDIVEKGNRYFHPIGRSGWPKEPPNYLGFRYDGRLQGIRHVQSTKVVKDLHSVYRSAPEDVFGPHMLYQLGPWIVPSKTIKTGKIFRNGRVWAALDLLLTCESISEARDMTKNRIEKY